MVPAVGVLALFLVPFIDRSPFRHFSKRGAALAFMTVLVVTMVGLTLIANVPTTELSALQFISGVWISVNQLPSWLLHTSQVFPLHWICRGLRQALLPDTFKVVETGGQWQLMWGLIVLAAWCIVGFLVCVRSFRWTRG